MAANDPNAFNLNWWLYLLFIDGRAVYNPFVAGVSNYLTDRTSIGSGFDVVQIRVCTDRYKNSTYPPGPNRIQVVRCIMDFWQPLDDRESEIDVFGGVPPGTMHADFEQYGGVDFWRDTYTSDAPAGVLGIDTEGGAPEFFFERIGLMAHYRISVGLELSP